MIPNPSEGLEILVPKTQVPAKWFLGVIAKIKGALMPFRLREILFMTKVRFNDQSIDLKLQPLINKASVAGSIRQKTHVAILPVNRKPAGTGLSPIAFTKHTSSATIFLNKLIKGYIEHITGKQ